MRSDEIVDLAVNALEDRKGLDIQVLDVRRLTDVTDYMIVASGRSDRQVRALADELVAAAKRSGESPLGVEGERDGEWILVDLCDVVVHLMQPHVRELYQLERLWADTEGQQVTTHILSTE
jgi:ribosome-associated protein